MSFLSFGKKKKDQVNQNKDQKVFSILLSQKTVQALFWMVTEGHIEIISQSTLKYFFDENDCLIKLDECLQELGPQSEDVSQTLFHLDSSMSDQAGLLPEKTDFLHHLTSTLSLNSIGVAANTEALAQVISQDVPKPYNLIIEFTSDKETWSLFGDEQLIWQKNVPHTADQAKDFGEAWLETKQQLPPGSTEQNLSVLFVSSIYNRSELLNKSEFFPAREEIEVEFIGAEEVLEKVVPPSAVALARENNWIAPEDLITEEVIAEAQTEELNEEVLAADAEAEKLAEADQGENFDRNGEPREIEDVEGVDSGENKKRSKKKFKFSTLAIIGVAAGLLVTLGIMLFVLSQTTQATVTVIPKEIALQKTTEIKINPDLAASDFDNMMLAGQLEKQNVTETASISATGKKKVGEKSVGKVDIINKKSTSEKKFAQGTILTVDGKKFVLDKEVTVPGASTEEKDGETIIKHSKTTAEVTAVEVGEEGNLKSGAKFKVGDYNTSDYEAEAVDNFGGGSSKTVTVATETDQKKLQDQLLKKILEEAETSLKAQKNTGKYLIPLTKSAKITNKVWSVPLDEETDELGLELTVAIPVISYEANDLKPLSQAVLNKELPEGYVLSAKEPQLMSAASSEQKEGEPIKLQVDVRSTGIAEVSPDGLAAQIVSLEVPQAQSKLKAVPGIAETEVLYSNDWYEIFFNSLPSKASKINVIVKDIDQN